ncbi:BrnT family toxin [Thiothrix eikelboomii]|uniref:BrnT family toxin n=1 Tax=Thiothrix eikelboomii TaxID=92487 RepID=UPI003BB107B8
MQFEWHEAKDTSNQRKHGISFELASLVFFDPLRIEYYDGRETYGEDRWITIGLVHPAMLYVVYTLRGENDENIRLISARKANENERRSYYQANH